MPHTVRSLLPSVSAQIGVLTRQINRYKKLKDGPHTPTSLRNLERVLEVAGGAMDKIMDLTAELETLEPDNGEHNTRATHESNRYDQLVVEIGQILEAAAPSPAPAVAAVPQAQAQVRPHVIKVVEALRPDKLTLDFTPAEFQLWTSAFKSFYSTSKLDVIPVVDQHAFLYACLDSDLQKRIISDAAADTPIFSDDPGVASMIGLLHSCFLHRYPLVQRRLDFFQYHPQSGQLASAWISELRMKADIADLDELSVDQLIAFRAITSIRDEGLQDELLKLKDPSLKDVEAEVLQYEAKISTKAKTTSVQRVRTFASDNRSSTPSRPKPRCMRCNRSHLAKDCKLPVTIECHRCHRPGHISPACRNEARVVHQDLVDEETVAATVSVLVASSGNAPTPKLALLFDANGIQFQRDVVPDTGATRTIIPYDVAQAYSLPLSPSRERIVNASGDIMDCSGEISLSIRTVEDNNVAVVKNALVSRDAKQILLSWQDLRSLCIIPQNFPSPMCAVNAISVPEYLNTLFYSYSDVLSDSLGTRCLDGLPMKIYLRDDVEVKPFKIFTTRQIPLHLQAQADIAIQKALEEGIICREDSPTDWCCRGGFVPKPNGTLRLITDFIPLNKFVKRPVHPFPSAMDIIRSISPNSKAFAVLDCTMGYFQVPLDKNSSKLTTFLLPQGRFRYLRAPMGLSASSDEFCRRSDEVLAGLEGVNKLVDDILVQAPDVDSLRARLEALFSRCREHGLTLSKRKAQFYTSLEDKPVKFAGYSITANGITPDSDKFAALASFPSPTSLTELRSFLGLANQFSPFLPDLAHSTDKMRLLLRKNTVFLWTKEIEADFQKAKTILTSKHVICPFDPTLPTELITDASRVGLGFVLIQRDVKGRPYIVFCGSRSLIPAETRYAVVELECLAAVYALTKCDFYLRGLSSFRLITDHRPLVGLFEKCPHDIANPRLQRFIERAAPYTFTVLWMAGKHNTIADALSRKPHFPPALEDSVLYVNCSDDRSDVRLQAFKQSAVSDRDYLEVITALLERKLPKLLPSTHVAQGFANVWARLSVADGLLLLDGYRIVPPAAHRKEVLRLLHVSHSGLVKTRKLAQQLYFWPNMMNELKLLVTQCSVCQSLQPSLPSEPKVHTVAAQAMDEISADLYEYGGKNYLLIIDRFSGYVWVHTLKSLHTGAVTSALLLCFYAYGFPKTVRTDGGPQFRSEFEAFCTEYGIKHDVSSPGHPDANGHAEAGVKAAKYLLIKCLKAGENFPRALMEWRNTPREDGFSPAQLYFGRRQRTLLPCLSQHLKDIDKVAAHEAREKVALSKQSYADLHARNLSLLIPSQRVLLQDKGTRRWDLAGRVLYRTKTNRSYYVRLDNGRVCWRNRRFLRPIGLLVPSSAAITSRSLKEESPAGPTLRPRRERSNYRQARKYVSRV